MPGETGLGSSERADLNVLELELRKLPAVFAVGFEGPSAGAPVAEDAILTVQLLVNDHDAGPTVEQQALDLARLHLGRPLQVVITPGVARDGVGHRRHRAARETVCGSWTSTWSTTAGPSR